jgi:subtilase family serine protease
MATISRLRAAAAVTGAAALTLGSLALAGAAQAAQRTTIAGTHPSWAVAAHRTGQTLASGTVSTRVYLAPRNMAGLTALATAVSTPGNASYRHFLSPAQVQARFGATSAQIGAVKSWLSQSGLRVTGVSDQVADGYVAATGRLSAASRAFGVSFAEYRVPGQGVVRGPEQAASVPASVASSVLSITGLSTARQSMRPETRLPGPPTNYWVARPCGAYYNQKLALSQPRAYGKHWPWAVCGYTPSQVRKAYGVTASGMTGAGQTVAIVDAYASPTMPKDANTYAKVVGDAPFAAGQYQQYQPGRFNSIKSCGAAGWYGEETLDVESVHGMAPGANVRFVAAASCNDSDLADADAYIVNHNLASIVSNSWDDTEAGAEGFTDVYHLIFATGAAEGIDFMFSSGDNGYEAPGEDPGYSGHRQVDYPTSDPFVTSVGGTSLAIGKHDNYLFETSWGTLLDQLGKNGKRGRHWQYTPPGRYPAWYDGSSGGGTSTLYQQPWYQAGVVPNSLSGTLPSGATSPTPMREVPDVSAYADPATGFLVGETSRLPDGKYGFALSRIGGTSVSCPTFAGIEADAQQEAGHTLGFANPAIYAMDGTSAFRDVTDHPLGAGPLAQVRVNYTNPYRRKGPLLYYLRTLGVDGLGADALHATAGYDDATGVGSPRNYIEFFKHG